MSRFGAIGMGKSATISDVEDDMHGVIPSFCEGKADNPGFNLYFVRRFC